VANLPPNSTGDGDVREADHRQLLRFGAQANVADVGCDKSTRTGQITSDYQKIVSTPQIKNISVAMSGKSPA